MKSTLNRVIAVVVLALVSLLITGLALAQTEWSLAVDPGPGAVDLMVQPELTITVTVSATADNALVLCSVQTGQVQAMSPGVYPLSHNGAIWSGDLTGDEPRSFTFTIRPGSWPETEVPCVVIDYGAVRQAVTATVQVEPFRFQ